MNAAAANDVSLNPVAVTTPIIIIPVENASSDVEGSDSSSIALPLTPMISANVPLSPVVETENRSSQGATKDLVQVSVVQDTKYPLLLASSRPTANHRTIPPNMSTPHGLKLAVHLITTYFGKLVSKVCECLLCKGTLSLVQVIRYTELSKQNVTNALFLLIQHNCVQAFTIQQPGGFGEEPKMMIQYMALHENIIHHMRFPKFLAIVSDEYGQQCMEIFEGLLQHGRLSLNKNSDRYKDKHKVDVTGGENNNSVDNVIHENFNKLVQARFIERCPAHEPFVPPSEEDDAPKKRTKRKQPEPEVCATNEKKEILWRVNFEEFVRRLRHKSCVSHVTTRLDSVVGIVLSAIFEATRRDETKVKMEKTVPLPLETIYEEAMKNEEGQSLTLERVRASLVQLGCEIPTIGIDETYSIDLKKIINQAQAQEVESIVLKKYGREAYRIFRLLSERESLFDTDKISNTTFVEKKDALKILFQLWKDDFLHMETIGSDVQKVDMLLWKLNKRALWEHVLDDMYHAALNLKLRLVYELEQAKDILRVHKGVTVGDEVLKRRKQVGDKWEVLESSLMIIDDAIMLFNAF
ncbi:uncharacterized protein [Rutidosis leptorrhynchoides]|uniref:uncharacterized protein n=1 Tax=Rutidosis leptorrhynchoides TaxID=125765 RepID=UPI003A9A4912